MSHHEGGRAMKWVLCAASVITTVFIVGILALPRWLPADDSLLTVTMWWMVFNQPHSCRGGGPRICTGTDLTNAEAEPALVWAAERRVRPGVPVSLKASLPVTSRHHPSGSGLLNPLAAEVHLALLTHRVHLPVHQRERLVAAFSDACVQTGCTNIQYAIHRPDTVNAQGHSTSGVWRVADDSQVPAPAYSTVWRSSHGLLGTLHTRLDVSNPAILRPSQVPGYWATSALSQLCLELLCTGWPASPYAPRGSSSAAMTTHS